MSVTVIFMCYIHLKTIHRNGSVWRSWNVIALLSFFRFNIAFTNACTDFKTLLLLWFIVWFIVWLLLSFQMLIGPVCDAHVLVQVTLSCSVLLCNLGHCGVKITHKLVIEISNERYLESNVCWVQKAYSPGFGTFQGTAFISQCFTILHNASSA